MKVLLVRFSSLGDVILLSSLFDGLRKEEVKFDVLTDSDYGELFKWDGRVNNVLEISDYSLSSLRRVAEKVNALNYDYVFDLHCVKRSFLLSFSLKAKVIRYRKRSLLRRASLIFKNLKSKWLFVPEMYAEPFREVGIEIEKPRPSISVPESVKERVKAVVPESPFIAISPGAKWEGKRYPVEKFAEVASMLKEKGFIPVVIGGKEDSMLGEFIKERVKGVLNLSGKLSILESMAALSFAKAVISNDSAVVHMARAVKTKVISIFGPTHPFFGFAPFSDEGIAITLDLPCSPCSLHGKRACRKPDCFEIEPSVIVERAIGLIKSA